jgi:phospholipid transport system substrate-binding protein
MKTFLLSMFTAVQLFWTTGASLAAAESTPDALIREVSDEVLAIVRADKGIQAGDHQRAIDLVESKVLPHFDFDRMTALAVGRDWRQASPAQRKQLAEEFRTLLVRTYSNALTAYKDQTIEIKPLRMRSGDDQVVVRTLVSQTGAKAVSIDYDLARRSDGWKVFDVTVAGVSLVTNYRDSFAQEVRNGGFDGLIRTLQAKNRSLEGSLAARGEKK